MRFLKCALVVLTLVIMSPSLKAAESCSVLFSKDSLHVSALVQKNKFVTSRDLSEYKSILHQDFADSLKKLGPTQHWIDLGAGKANAQIEYLKSFESPLMAPQATAVAYKLDRWFSPPKLQGKLMIREGAFELQATSTWKKADLITDLFGVISYTPALHSSLQKIVDLLNVQGELFIYTTPYLTEFRTAAGSFKLRDFLSSIDGLRVEGDHGSLKVIKEKEQVLIPELKLLRFRDEAPPSRVFQVLEFDL
ncbi:hypothetical protein D3C87_241850 [compost metagenome]